MKDKIFKVVFFLSLFISLSNVFGQSDQQYMHDKYWFYRYRLTHELMKTGLGSCGAPSGYSIPPLAAYEHNQDLHFGDGTSYLGNYIGVLATELRLLFNSGASAAQINRVKEELFFAMKAYERLDLQAEVIMKPNRGSCGDPANGFFIRDDVGQNNYFHDFPTPIRPNGDSKILISDYEGAKNTGECDNGKGLNGDPKEDFPYRFPTVDQISNLLVGFALVVKSLDGIIYTGNGNNYSYSNMAKEYTDKMLTYLRDNNYTLRIPYAHDDNGKECFARHGSFETQALAFALSEAGYRIKTGSLGGDPVVKFGSFDNVNGNNPYTRAPSVPLTATIWQNLYNYPAGIGIIRNNYDEGPAGHEYNNALLFQLAAIGNSWKAGLLSNKTTIAVLTAPGWVCEGRDCLVGNPGGGCLLYVDTGCDWKWDAPIPVDIYCYNSNVTSELAGYIQQFISVNSFVPAWLDGFIPLMCSPAPLPEFSVNTTSLALSRYGNEVQTEYFPMLHHYLHDCGSYSYDAGSLYNKLLSAPCTGPHYKPERDINNPPPLNAEGNPIWTIPSTSEGVEGWRAESRWEKSNAAHHNEFNNGGGAWNGIDYMIAYNLFYLKRGEIEGFPVYQDKLKRELKNKIYPVVLTPVKTKGSILFPYTELGFETIYAENYRVNADANPLLNGDVTFHAGQSIKIRNLTVKNGAKFKAYIDPVFGCIQENGTPTKYQRESNPAQEKQNDSSKYVSMNKELTKQFIEKSDEVRKIISNNEANQRYTSVPTYISSNTKKSEISLFPNPASDKLFLTKELFESEQLNVQIFDLLGKEELNKTYQVRNKLNEIIEIDISGMQQGYYLCKVSCGSYCKTFQFIKKP